MENVPTPSQKQLQMLGYVSATNVNSLDCIINRKSLKYGTAMAHTIAAVEYESGGFSSRVQTEDCLLLEKYFGCAKFFEEDVCGFDTVVKWIKRWLRQ